MNWLGAVYELNILCKILLDVYEFYCVQIVQCMNVITAAILWNHCVWNKYNI